MVQDDSFVYLDEPDRFAKEVSALFARTSLVAARPSMATEAQTLEGL